MPKQVLSSALDNAATREEWDVLLDAMAKAPELKAAWSRAHQRRDAQANVALAKGHESFTSSVMAAIALEPQQSTVVPLPVSRVEQPAPRTVARPQTATRWKTWVPVSAAAGALAAALLFGMGKPVFTVGEPATLASSTAPVAVANNFQTVGWSRSSNSESAVPATDADTQALLDSYLMEHSNSVASQDVGGSLAGARFAVQSASYQPGE